jgi:parallel beta-helix repeat protein
LFAVDAVISNNRISGGNTLLGIAAEGSSECMVLGNNVQQLDALWAPVGLLTTDWGWGPMETSYCTVVGGNNKTNVYDEGIGNVLVGVNNMQGNPPGPAISDAMKRKLEMIKSIRRP